MRFLAATKCVITISWIATLTTGSPLQQHEVEDLGSANNPPLRQRQSSGTYAITGIQNGGIHPRLNIRDMMNNTDMFNLYLLGLRRFMDTPESDPLSYHSICCKPCCRRRFERLATDMPQQFMAAHISPSMESLVLHSSGTVLTCPTSSHNGIARICCSLSKYCMSISSPSSTCFQQAPYVKGWPRLPSRSGTHSGTGPLQPPLARAYGHQSSHNQPSK